MLLFLVQNLLDIMRLRDLVELVMYELSVLIKMIYRYIMIYC